jgi:hypothetical protein
MPFTFARQQALRGRCRVCLNGTPRPIKTISFPAEQPRGEAASVWLRVVSRLQHDPVLPSFYYAQFERNAQRLNLWRVMNLTMAGLEERASPLTPNTSLK